MKEVDEIWVPSAFNVASFTKAGVPKHKVFKVVEPIDIDRFRVNSECRTDETIPHVSEGGFRFLSIFSWHLRKGWDILLRAFVEEFCAEDDVSLVIRTDRFATVDSDLFEIIQSTRSRKKSAPNVHLIAHPVTDSDITALYRSCDAYVLPSRGEGWGRPFMEAMACQIPVIGTGWGGNMEFMNDGNSFLIDYDIVDVSPAAALECPVFHGQRWAEPSKEHLRSLMRAVYEGGPEVAKRVAAASDTAERYTIDKVTTAFYEQALGFLERLVSH